MLSGSVSTWMNEWTLVNASEVWINCGEMGLCFQTGLRGTPYHLIEQQQQQLPWLHQFRFGWTSAHPITQLNLVQSQRLSHTFFFFLACLSRDFFFFVSTCGSPLLTQLPRSKKIPTYPAPLPMLWILFFKALFLFDVIVNATTV
jgi:hypothetical protein